MRRGAFLVLVCVGMVNAQAAVAQDAFVVGGQTNVLLDVSLLGSVGLNLSGVSEDVIAPGNLGDDSVAFAINSRDATSLPTTFAYTVGRSGAFQWCNRAYRICILQ